MLAGTAAAVAVVAVIVAVVFATKGGASSPGPGLEAAASTAASDVAPTESTPAASTPTETTATTPSVESSQVEQVLNEYQQSYSAENIDGLKAIFAEGLERRDGNRAPENQAAALATYEHQFSQLKNPTYSLSETNVQPGTGEATATARYSISSQNGTVTGSITFHLVEQGEKLLIDKLSISPSK
jgi:hypothetical protein